jgi:hypothetical protein
VLLSVSFKHTTQCPVQKKMILVDMELRYLCCKLCFGAVSVELGWYEPAVRVCDWQFRSVRGLDCDWLFLSFIKYMQGIYRYMPEKHYVFRVCIFAVVLYLQFVLHAMLFAMLNVLYFHISTSRSTCAVPNMAVLRTFDFVPSSYVAQVLSE